MKTRALFVYPGIFLFGLVIWSCVTAVNSDMEPTNVEAFKKYVPSFEAKIIPGVGHLLFWENSGEFNRLPEESIQEFLQE